MKLKTYISLILVLLMTSIASAQVKFEAKVSKTQLGANERLRVDFEMNKDGDNFVPPDFKNFQIIGGPNQSVSQSWMNGKRSFSKTYSYFLAPKQKGNFRISSASIEIDGEIYKTKAIAIKVSKAVELPKDPNDPNYIAKNKVHVVGVTSNNNPYLNEAVTVEYRLYVAPRTGVSNWREITTPTYDGFWNQVINKNDRNVYKTQFKGEEYRYVILKRAVLYPQKTGDLKLEPLKLEVSIDVPTGRYDFFGNPVTRPISKNIATGTKTINVKPLPEEGKPDFFTGAVGQFKFDTALSKAQLDANQSLELAVKVKGKGNLKLFNLPSVNLPNSLEVYEPEHNEKVKTYVSGMQGFITDTYTIVPQYKGKYPIPSINFSYFDPKTETYKTLESGDMSIDVINGPVAEEEKPVTATTNTINPNDNTNAQFTDIKTETVLNTPQKNRFFKSTGFWSALVLPLLAIPLALVIRRKREDYLSDVIGNKSRTANRLSRKYLGTAKRSLGDKTAFYIALEKALHNYLKAKLRIETSEMSKDNIKELLSSKQVSTENINAFLSLLESCEQARYSPITNVEMQQDFDKSSETITAIDKEIK